MHWSRGVLDARRGRLALGAARGDGNGNRLAARARGGGYLGRAPRAATAASSADGDDGVKRRRARRRREKGED